MLAAQEQMPPSLVTRMWVGATCAACGILIVPVFVAVVCLVPIAAWAVRQHRTRCILWLCAIGIGGMFMGSISAYSIWKLVHFGMYQYEQSLHTCMLSAAIYVYHERYRRLPETLEEIRQTGLYGSQAYRFPDSDNGVPPIYLPVTHWDGKAPVVVAVTGRSRDYPRDYSERMRGYVILGDTGGHSASERELEWILKADDVVRAALGEPKRWESVNWR